jgi:hypothetical protein
MDESVMRLHREFARRKAEVEKQASSASASAAAAATTDADAASTADADAAALQHASDDGSHGSSKRDDGTNGSSSGSSSSSDDGRVKKSIGGGRKESASLDRPQPSNDSNDSGNPAAVASESNPESNHAEGCAGKDSIRGKEDEARERKEESQSS